MMTGNKGEWSEIYTLLKVITDKQLYAGDSQLNKIENLIFPIIKVLRDESNGTFEFSYENDLVLVKNDIEEVRISINEFQKQAHFLLNKLKSKTSTTFTVPEIEQFINTFNNKSLKAKSSVKSDIKIVIQDKITGTNPILGFSIKSQMGGASTLLNAGRTTNFIYQIIDFKGMESDIIRINEIDTRFKIKDRVDEILKLRGKLKFISVENDIFKNNLILIDSLLPNILAELIRLFNSSSLSKINKLTEQISLENPLQFDTQFSHSFYEYKIKRFLTDVALGMMPSKVWTGILDATGGYLVVKNDGEVLCYHIYNRNDFEEYLFHNTKLETASSTRHDFGKVYSDGENLYFKLNLQIRFI